MPRNGEWRLIEVDTVCWIGTESCLSRIGNLGRTDLLKVGEEGAVCGREGGKGLSTICDKGAKATVFRIIPFIGLEVNI